MHKTFSGLLFLTFLCLTALLPQACTKKDIPELTDPNVLLTPGILEGRTGQTVTTNLTITSLNKINRLLIVETYKGIDRTLLDSAINPAVSGLDRQFLYDIPDTAVKGDQITITFRAFDTKGLSTSSDLDVRVIGGQPTVTVTPETSTAATGDTVRITADIRSALPNLRKIQVSSRINTDPLTILQTDSLNSQQQVTYQFPYAVPLGAVAGDMIYLLFTATDSDGGEAFDSHVITVK